MVDSHSKRWLDSSIRQSVFGLLERNPLLTAKSLCKLLDLSYERYQAYVNRLKHEWKSNRANEQGSKCSIHAWRGWCYVPRGIDRSRAVDEGWLKSRARNRWLLWKDRLGRLQWFETGRVSLYVRKPANLGRAYQLVCNGFSFTSLVRDVKVLQEILCGIRFKGAHYVFPVGQHLPRLTIDLFQKSNGIIIKVGDSSHPDCLEVLATYPDWAERNERVLEQLSRVLQRVFESSTNLQLKSRVDYVS